MTRSRDFPVKPCGENARQAVREDHGYIVFSRFRNVLSSLSLPNSMYVVHVHTSLFPAVKECSTISVIGSSILFLNNSCSLFMIETSQVDNEGVFVHDQDMGTPTNEPCRRRQVER
jgi:hypothetical protein